MKITPEVRAFALEQAGKRCECAGQECRHHLRGTRCKRGLRGNEWKVYWRTDGGVSRDNIEAWCLECFANNFAIPREAVTLLAPGIVDYARLLEEDRWRAITVRSALHDSAVRAAEEHNGHVVLGRRDDDDVLVELATSRDAVEAARDLRSAFPELVLRLDLPVPELCVAIHCGETTRWRNGLLVGEGVETTMSIRGIAGAGQVVLTGPAAAPLWGKVEMEALPADVTSKFPPMGGLWALLR